MEQWGVSGALSTTNGVAQVAYASTTFTFPVDYISAPLRQNIHLTAGAGNYLVWPGQINTPSVSGFTAYLVGSGTNATGTLGYHTWGKWK